MNNKTALQGRFADATAGALSARFAALVNLHGRTRSRCHLQTTPDVGAHGAAGNCAANRRDVIAAPVADLVAENTADYGTDHGAWDVIAAFSLDLLLLDPAFLFRSRNHRAHCRHVRCKY